MEAHRPRRPQEVVLVRTGTANVASINAALERAGLSPRVSSNPADVVEAQLVVLPGVGAFGAAMDSLRRTRVDEAITARVALGRPLLAICLGLQLLCASSEESPGVAGLGIIPSRITRLRPGPGLCVPHLGWNVVTPAPGFTLAPRGRAYFANSYKLDAVPMERGASVDWAGCAFDHGGTFVAAVQRGTLLACQFHPELSGVWGAALIKRWVESSLNVEGLPCSAAV